MSSSGSDESSASDELQTVPSSSGLSTGRDLRRLIARWGLLAAFELIHFQNRREELLMAIPGFDRWFSTVRAGGNLSNSTCWKDGMSGGCAPFVALLESDGLPKIRHGVARDTVGTVRGMTMRLLLAHVALLTAATSGTTHRVPFWTQGCALAATHKQHRNAKPRRHARHS